MNSDQQNAYNKLLIAIHIYLTKHYECYIDYNKKGRQVFGWMLDSKDLELLRAMQVPKEFKFKRVGAYEAQVMAVELSIPATLVHHAFIEVISNEFIRTTKHAG